MYFLGPVQRRPCWRHTACVLFPSVNRGRILILAERDNYPSRQQQRLVHMSALTRGCVVLADPGQRSIIAWFDGLALLQKMGRRYYVSLYSLFRALLHWSQHVAVLLSLSLRIPTGRVILCQNPIGPTLVSITQRIIGGRRCGFQRGSPALYGLSTVFQTKARLQALNHGSQSRFERHYCYRLQRSHPSVLPSCYISLGLIIPTVASLSQVLLKATPWLRPFLILIFPPQLPWHLGLCGAG